MDESMIESTVLWKNITSPQGFLFLFASQTDLFEIFQQNLTLNKCN